MSIIDYGLKSTCMLMKFVGCEKPGGVVKKGKLMKFVGCEKLGGVVKKGKLQCNDRRL